MTDTYPRGVRYVRGVDLIRVIELAPQYEQVPDIWERYNETETPVSLPDFLVGLSTAFAAKLLIHSNP